MVGKFLGCCALATSGHAAAAPPSKAMNSRRLDGQPHHRDRVSLGGRTS